MFYKDQGFETKSPYIHTKDLPLTRSKDGPTFQRCLTLVSILHYALLKR